jgi:hypothetical protein
MDLIKIYIHNIWMNDHTRLKGAVLLEKLFEKY